VSKSNLPKRGRIAELLGHGGILATLE